MYDVYILKGTHCPIEQIKSNQIKSNQIKSNLFTATSILFYMVLCLYKHAVRMMLGQNLAVFQHPYKLHNNLVIYMAGEKMCVTAYAGNQRWDSVCYIWEPDGQIDGLNTSAHHKTRTDKTKFNKTPREECVSRSKGEECIIYFCAYL